MKKILILLAILMTGCIAEYEIVKTATIIKTGDTIYEGERAKIVDAVTIEGDTLRDMVIPLQEPVIGSDFYYIEIIEIRQLKR